MDKNLNKAIQDKLELAIVKIATTSGPKGTGFFISFEGHVLTAWHCIEEVVRFGFSDLLVICNGQEIAAELDRDKSLPDEDIAILKVNCQVPLCLPLGLVNENCRGDDIVSIGYPAHELNASLGRYPGSISRLDGNKIEVAGAIQGKGQSGGLIYHYESKQVVGLVIELYQASIMRNVVLAARFDSLLYNWPELKQMMVITEIEIKNFKCFENFKVNGFKRINLIGGKNNVGKTAFLEACYINLNGDKQYYLNAILKIIRQRDNFFEANHATSLINFFKIAFFYHSTLSKQYSKNLIHTINSNLKKTDFIFERKLATTVIKYTVEGENDTVNIEINDFKETLKTDIAFFDTNNQINFVRPIGFADEIIIERYSSLQMDNKEDFLNKELNIFDENIVGFKIINNSPELNTTSNNYLSLSQFGNGVKHFINIIISIYASKNGCLLIDEIDNGIHYTQLDRLWEIILTTAKEVNCQVFVTTHSKECIESYCRVCKQLEEKDITYTVMTRLKSGRIRASVYDYELLENAMEQEHEVR